MKYKIFLHKIFFRPFKNMKLYYLGQFNSNGISNYLNNDGIFDSTISSLLSAINALLPERQKLHHVHPEWLNDNTFDIVDNTEISVTFVDEGAGYRNSIAYFIYDSKNPPKSIAHINECYFIFPNCSKVGSGGALNPGDTIKLAYGFSKHGDDDDDSINYITPTNYTFPAGKSVGFLLFPNAWQGNKVTKYVNPYSSTSSMNPEKAPELKYHTACLQIPGTSRLLLGFEDLNRESSGCDHDFNDAMLIVDINLDSVGKGFTDTRGFEPNDEEPDMPSSYTIGYKKIYALVEGKIVECVVTLFIPKTSTIVKKHNYTTRHKTNRAYVKSIIVVQPKTNRANTDNYISRKLNSGFSWYNSSFTYNKGAYVESSLENLQGIYFYYTFKEAMDYDFDPMKI